MLFSGMTNLCARVQRETPPLDFSSRWILPPIQTGPFSECREQLKHGTKMIRRNGRLFRVRCFCNQLRTDTVRQGADQHINFSPCEDPLHYVCMARVAA